MDGGHLEGSDGKVFKDELAVRVAQRHFLLIDIQIAAAGLRGNLRPELRRHMIAAKYASVNATAAPQSNIDSQISLEIAQLGSNHTTAAGLIRTCRSSKERLRPEPQVFEDHLSRRIRRVSIYSGIGRRCVAVGFEHLHNHAAVYGP